MGQSKYCEIGTHAYNSVEATHVVRTKRFIPQSTCDEHAKMFRELGMFAGVVHLWPVDDWAFADDFERKAYGGYTSYGYSMSDGYYGPLQREAFVHDLRSSAKRATDADAFQRQNFRYDTEFNPSVEDSERYMRVVGA